MQEDKLERWKTRFARAAKLLSERLDDPPPLEDLAAAAAISPYHFHRIWRALTGETVRETVLR
ncbi:MAG TPA: AraC family transcriptional regulator, partial [Magnetospirillaceae bacterium]|nr:AraC family transcriptional regulator [Magnetospirillaceae bacterium]